MKKENYWEVKRKIEMLRTLAASGASPSKHLPLIRSVFRGIHLPAITIKNEVLYRSRWNKGNQLFTHTNELSYPDNRIVVKKGRLNDIGESVLYAAACELGTIIESRPDLNKLFTISLIEPLNHNLLYFPLGMVDKGYYSHKYSPAEKLVIEYTNTEITKVVKTLDDYNPTIALAMHFLRTNIVEWKIRGALYIRAWRAAKYQIRQLIILR